MEKDYIIDQVGWHTQIIGNPESTENTHGRFRSLIEFLQRNDLLRNQLLIGDAEITDSLCIKVSDLTEEGYYLMKSCYDKWLRGIDNGKSYNDFKVFEKQISELRRGKIKLEN